MALTIETRARFPFTFERAGLPYPGPAAGTPLRLAFVGQSTFFEACALTERSDRIHTRFVEFRAGADAERLLEELAAAEPHVVVVFRPEIVPAGLFAGLRAATVGFLTEPLPRTTGKAHPDLERRLADLRAADPSNFDRIVSFDPLFVEVAEAVAPVWRSLPLPVADRYYRDVRPIAGRPRILFVGRSTEHRERFLTPAKHELDLLHLAFGVDADRLEEELDRHDVGINLHNEPYASFENRVCIHLAAGHLVLTEPLDPTHGLEPGIDYLEVRSPDELLAGLTELVRFPSLHDSVRVRGRMKAEQFRASDVYPRLVHDLYLDLATFGTERAG